MDLDPDPQFKCGSGSSNSNSCGSATQLTTSKFNIQNLVTPSLEVLGNLLLDTVLLLLLPAVGHGGKVGPRLPNVADENSRLGGPEMSLSIIIINYN
jgi:hypothetical protein